MSHRSPARFLAPLALVAFALALLIVLNSSGGDEQPASGASGEPAKTTTDRKQAKAKTETTTTTAGQPEPAATAYTIRAGDTLSTIAEKTGVPVETLLELNPDVDPQALSTGQRLKLKQ
jgi:LysM repeat protein